MPKKWKMMQFFFHALGILPKAFSQGWLPKSQKATCEMFNFPSVNFPKVRLDPLRIRRLQWGRGLRLEQAWEPSVVVRTDLGSCRLGNCTFGKFPLHTWETTTWEKSLKKVPNMMLYACRWYCLKEQMERNGWILF